ncbi:unnamed protein product [Schistocephalus solidus]|uniref:Uncharacterized protein n=1 Tax=Schistocephalus solidus TaxID=70667 RepID=A0A183TS51_SCHSO|nr:unnamed protein product [Schistocephalus solidus]
MLAPSRGRKAGLRLESGLMRYSFQPAYLLPPHPGTHLFSSLVPRVSLPDQPHPAGCRLEGEITDEGEEEEEEKEEEEEDGVDAGPCASNPK